MNETIEEKRMDPSNPAVGDIFSQGAALAMYWPDEHPEGASPVRAGRPWVVFTHFGGIDFTNKAQWPDTGNPRFVGNIFNGCNDTTPLPQHQGAGEIRRRIDIARNAWDRGV